MSWEAHRLTSKSPAEVYTVLGPHGCDDLLRQAWAACWREHPEETRTFKAVRQRFFETFTRNLNIWRRIKKPTPQDVAAALLYFVTSGTYVTGQILRLDGGRSIT